MSLQDLALPVDVPLKLIATSRKDMLASRADIFPKPMWKSSLAIFAYDPDLSDLPDVFPDRAITFLKIVCSITSYAPGCQDIPPPPNPKDYGEDLQGYYNDLAAWQKEVDEIKKLEQTYPCSGALVQVAIYPRESDTDINDISKLAYFASLQPQKRELLEAVTESGESVTQSKSQLNVRKGVTSTNEMEDRDIFTGANLSVSYAGAGIGGGVQGQWGTIKKSGTESVDTTTNDASREAREGASHTTSLSQLYHLLNSYHLGTNRAIFFIQPRPHTVQQKDRFTFIDGPQEIEGIQEFFLVVDRPKSMILEKYCVDALLYTAHLDEESTRSVIMESKTFESEWIELWATAAPLPHDSSSSDSWWTVFYDPIEFTEYATDKLRNDLKGAQDFFKSRFLGQPAQAPQVNTPSVLDLTITPEDAFKTAGIIGPPTITRNNAPSGTGVPVKPSFPGWQIDRTRGLGGYDLWEDPDNVSATPFGNKQSTKPPQAFIDIIPFGAPGTLNYYPDYALRIRAYAWPRAADDGQAMYHARIKVYLIRNDTPTEDRSIPLFVTVRGVSSCAESPFAVFYDNTLVDSSSRKDITYEHVIHPPNIASWLNQPLQWPAMNNTRSTDTANQNQPNTAPPQTLTPINSAKPSGLDPIALGSARAKMANAIADQVRVQLKTSLTCPQQDLIDFRATDLFFNRIAPVVIAEEVKRLTADRNAEKQLASYVSSHPTVPTIVGGGQQALASSRAVSPTGTPRAKPLVASSSFPALTLGSSALTRADRQALHEVGIVSGLDLLGLSASNFALRLGVDEAKARQIRLQAIGLSTGQVVPGTPPSDGSMGSNEKRGVKKGGVSSAKQPRKR